MRRFLPARPAAPSGPGPGAAAAHKRPRLRRDRRGHGLRGPLAPQQVPLSLTRAQRFDELVSDAVERLERRWAGELAAVEFAVDDVPPPGLVDPAGDPVPLGRVLRPAGSGPARIVVYRRPVEARAVDRADLGALVHDVVVEQVADLLGLAPEIIDPGYAGDEPDDEE